MQLIYLMRMDYNNLLEILLLIIYLYASEENIYLLFLVYIEIF